MDSISCHSMCLDINRRLRMQPPSTESTTVSSEARRRTPSMRRTMPHSQPSKSHRQRGVANQKPATAGAAAADTKKQARLSLTGLHVNEVLPARQISRDPSARSGRTDAACATATSSGWISEALSLIRYNTKVRGAIVPKHNRATPVIIDRCSSEPVADEAKWRRWRVLDWASAADCDERSLRDMKPA